MLKLNYGINRRVGRRIVHQNGKLCVKGEMSDGTTHAKVLAAVQRRHPGWNLTGYARRPEPRRRHVVMCQHRFVPLIDAGTKLSTIRGERVREIRVGDVLDLRTWSGAPYRSKQVKIREVLVDRVRPIIITWDVHSYVKLDGKYLSFLEIDDLAVRDGFEDDGEFFRFFRDTHGKHFEGQLIEWRA